MDLEYIRHTTEFQVSDRKSVRIEPKALAVPIIAMANADGGVIALSVEDDGALTGATIWQHEVVGKNESDQVGTNFDQAEGTLTEKYRNLKLKIVGISYFCTKFSLY